MADGGDKEVGIAAAIRERHDEAMRRFVSEGTVPAQLPLLPLQGAGYAVDEGSGETGSLPVAGETRGKGRPPGSKNRRTQDWVDYILARYPSPLEAMASCYARPIEVLMTELSCSRLDAYKIQQNAAAQLAPYIHQKQPQAVQIDGKGLFQLIIQGVDDDDDVAAALDDDSLIIDGTVEPGPEGGGG